MEHKKVLYISQEIAPYLPETPLSKFGKELPQGTLEQGFEVRTFMPKYGCINERRNQLHEVIRLSGMNIVIDDTDHPLIIKVATMQPSRMQVYFIDNDDYFHYSPDKTLEIHSQVADNDERIIFFARGVIETVKKLRWEPAVIHCLGWTSALAPLYLRKLYGDDPTFSNAKIVYALHSESFNEPLDARFVEKLKMNQFSDEDLKSIIDGQVDYTKLNRLAIDYADAIVEASEGIDPDLIEYARNSNKPFLPFNADESTFIQNYIDFYSTLLD